MNLRTILIILATIVGVIIANWLFWHLLGIVTLGFFLVLWLAFLGACCYGAFLLIRSLLGKKSASDSGQNQSDKPQYKLWNISQTSISMFLTQPSAQQVMLLELDAHETLKSANIVKIPIDTKVTILEDTGKECVKVRLQGSTLPQNVGWVARGSLVKESS